MLNQATPFEQKINRRVRLPILSKNIQQLIAVLNDENMSYQRLGKMLGIYPEISVRLIALVNSVWSSPAKPITDLESTCVRLGMPVVKSVCIALAVGSIFDSRRCPSFDAERFWVQSLLVADAAHFMANKLTPKQSYNELRQAAQIAGLLHNLGMLWLADNLPLETDQALKLHDVDPAVSINQSLQQFAGVNYCEVNAWLAEQWKLPEMLAIVMQHHLELDYSGYAWQLNLLLNISNEMVKARLEEREALPKQSAFAKLGLADSEYDKAYEHISANLEKTYNLVHALFMRPVTTA